MGKINIMIADDHKLFREGLKLLLGTEENLSVISEVADGVECLSKLAIIKPNILLLDVCMPRLDGLSLFKRIKELFPEQKVIFLTGYNDIENLYKAYSMGCNGFVLKESSFTSLKKAIRVVMDGGQYIEPVMIPLLKDKIDAVAVPEQKNDDSILTKRELQILRLVAQGLYNKEIADKLNVTEKTVKNHITNLFKKINVTDRTQAAVYAIKNGYVNMD